MKAFRSILVAVDDGGPRRGLLARAARLARESGARLTLAGVVEPLPWYSRLVLPAADDLEEALVRERAETLTRLAEELKGDGPAVAATVLRGRRHVELVREVIRAGHDLLIKEAEPNENVLFGSTDMHLLRTCPCPIWIMKPGHAERPIKQVLVPIDPSPPPEQMDLLYIKVDLEAKDPSLDAKLLGLAGSLAESEGADVHVLHAWRAPGESLARGEAMLSQGQVERYVDDCRAEAKKAIDGLLAGVPDPSGRRFAHLVKGAPADAIAEFAKAGRADLIVMGTVARAGILGILIGNTAESILQRVDCSVLAVKPDGFVSPVTLD